MTQSDPVFYVQLMDEAAMSKTLQWSKDVDSGDLRLNGQGLVFQGRRGSLVMPAIREISLVKYRNLARLFWIVAGSWLVILIAYLALTSMTGDGRLSSAGLYGMTLSGLITCSWVMVRAKNISWMAVDYEDPAGARRRVYFSAPGELVWGGLAGGVPWMYIQLREELRLPIVRGQSS